MDTLTHGLAGALIARALPPPADEGLDGALARREVWTGFFVAMFPDADVFVSPFSAEFYITQHRALTHSFVTLPVWIVLLTAVAALRLAPRLGPPGSAFRRIAVRRLGVVVALALVSHILLDWITSWGTMFLSPLAWTRFTLDWTFIVDLSLSGLLALALLGTGIIARRSLGRSRTAARAGLLAATAYIGLCAVRHAEALGLTSSLGARGAHRAAIPQPGSPDRWLLLSDDGAVDVTAAFVDLAKHGREGARAPGAEELARTGFRSGLLKLYRHLGSVYRSRDDLSARVIGKANGPFARRALESGIAGVFGRFARFPTAREETKGEGVEVLLRDVRFGYLSNEVDPFTYVVRYAPDGTVLFAGFPSLRWSRSAPAQPPTAAR